MAVAEEKQGVVGRTGNFFTEVRAEMRKVTWPTRGELYGATMVVVAVTVVVCIMLGIIDWGLGKVIEFLMTSRS